MAKKDEITKYYSFKFLTGLHFIEGIFILFLLSIGLDYTQVLVTQSIYALSVLLSQIPSGALSDMWSRKKVISIGTIVGALASLIYATSNGFWGIVLGETLFGIAVAFSFGSLSSFAYDTIIEQEEEKLSKRILSKG